MSALCQRTCRKDPKDMQSIWHQDSIHKWFNFQIKLPIEFNIKNCIYSIPGSCGKTYKGETGCPLKVRLEDHRKAVVRGEIKKSGMADHIWKEKGNHLPLWDEVEIIDRGEHWRIRRLKESGHMVGCNDLLSRPSIELNTIWEPKIKKIRKKKCNNKDEDNSPKTLTDKNHLIKLLVMLLG